MRLSGLPIRTPKKFGWQVCCPRLAGRAPGRGRRRGSAWGKQGLQGLLPLLLQHISVQLATSRAQGRQLTGCPSALTIRQLVLHTTLAWRPFAAACEPAVPAHAIQALAMLKQRELSMLLEQQTWLMHTGTSCDTSAGTTWTAGACAVIDMHK